MKKKAPRNKTIILTGKETAAYAARTVRLTKTAALSEVLDKTICQDALKALISIHGLRHTHASLLLFAGVSIASVARRLGHASMTTTQKTYLHIIQELENKDVDLVMRTLSGL